VRLAALNLKEDHRVDLGDLGSGSVISENLRFHLNSWVSHFFTECRLLCNSVEFVTLDAHSNP